MIEFSSNNRTISWNRKHLLSAHETDLNTHDNDKHNSDIATEDNPAEHNFINYEDVINVNTSVNN